ncbi:hypothetical protein TNCV_4809721 [Trichonephila clavipes]|nr:hypothetical protein TNCV_4809721 [Trichonephila clavipes]
MNCQTKLRINHLTAVKSVAILEIKRVWERPDHRDENCRLVDAPCCWPGGSFGVPLEIVGSSGHEKVLMLGKSGLERPGRPRGERIEGLCGKHL